MLTLLQEILVYDFLVRALLVGSLVSVCAALLGVTLVLKRYSMIGDGLSHVGFGALSIALALNVAPLTISLPIVLVAAVLLLRLSENSRIKGDAAIALISSSAIAVGVIITTLTGGLNVDIYSYMFGSILAMSRADVYLGIAISSTVFLLFVVFYHKIFAVTFDETFAAATGTKAGLYNLLIALLTSLTIVVGMRIMGTLLISSLIIFPALAAMRLFRGFRAVVIFAGCLSLFCFFWGVVASFQFSLPTGASIVMVNLASLGLCALINLSLNRYYRRKEYGTKANRSSQ